ncbi:MAG: trypsin-like peptidase domain-containing protein [Clostridium sp.]|uniref:trypsin-like peptidase domain-containing protein n=1 Tax=Clostridium sp. TaxID=1506 RepID=UPI003D6CA1EB
MSTYKKTNFIIGILIISLITSIVSVLYISFYKKTNTLASVFNSKKHTQDDINETIVKLEQGIVMITSKGNSTTGIILNDEGYILTHELLDKTTHKVFLQDGVQINYKKIESKDSNNLGLNLIKVDSKYAHSFVHLGNSDNIKKGQVIYSISNLFGYFGSVTRGIVSITNTSIGTFNGLMLTDAVAHDGSLGGAIFDDTQKILGIILDYYVDLDTKYNSGLGVVLPVNKVKLFLEDNLVNYLE